MPGGEEAGLTEAMRDCITVLMRLKGTRAGSVSPLLVLRFPEKFHRMLKRMAKERKIKPSALARKILEKALEAVERRR